MSGRSFLVVDDDQGILKLIQDYMGMEGYSVEIASSVQEALVHLKRQKFDGVITDLNMPEESGMSIVMACQTLPEPPVVIVMSGYANVQIAVEAMHFGAFYVIEKPISFARLFEIIDEAFDSQQHKDERLQAGEMLKRFCYAPDSPMRSIDELISRVAPAPCAVLITGESGTGKEVIAQLIHERSQRKGPFVPVNCGAIPEHLLESELFGHVKGSFTGALRDRKGRLAEADEGTLFLDEIGDMPQFLQVKLLRVLQEGKYTPLGSNQEQASNFRILAATNHNIEDAVKAKTFRLDLYYRLNVFRITLPPLRERRSDIEILGQHYLNAFNQLYGTTVSGMSRSAFDMLKSADWPGNIRELQNLIQYLIIQVGSGEIQPAHLPEPYRKDVIPASIHQVALPEEGISLLAFLEHIENQLIKQALERTKGNKKQAARLLKINRTTLIEKLKRKGLEVLDENGE